MTEGPAKSPGPQDFMQLSPPAGGFLPCFLLPASCLLAVQHLAEQLEPAVDIHLVDHKRRRYAHHAFPAA